MNIWSTQTLRIVNGENYLDRLQEVYPHEDAERDVPDAVLESIKRSYDNRNHNELLNGLLNLKKFPYKDSYVAFLRKDRDAIRRNPQTVERIIGRIYEMGIEEVIEGIKQPKEANQRRGNQFSRWLGRECPAIKSAAFRASKAGVYLLDATEHEARDFCNAVMGVGISKRPDLVMKVNTHYVIGEAKFLSSTGGNQDRAFDDGMALANNATGNAYKVFILDGVHWIETGSEQYTRIDHSNSAIFSVLLLRDYLRSL